MNPTHDEKNCAPLDKIALEAVLNNPTCRVHIQGSEDIVQKYNIRSRINCARQSNSSLKYY